MCIRIPGPALISQMPPPVSRQLRVDDVGDVRGRPARRKVRSLPQEDHLALVRHRVEGHASFGQDFPLAVAHLDPGEHVLMADAAPGVLVHHVDQVADRRPPVAHDVGRKAPGCGAELAVNHEQAMVRPRDHLLDEHAASLRRGDREGGFDLLGRLEVHRHAAAVVAVRRLHDDRPADLLRRADGIIRVPRIGLLRHGQAEVAEKRQRGLLVLGEVDGDAARVARQGRLDAFLVLPVAELDEARIVEAHPRDAPGFGRFDERLSGRAEDPPAGECHVIGDLGPDVEGLVGQGVDEFEEDQARKITRLDAGGTGQVAEEHVAFGRRVSGHEPGDLDPCPRLTLEGQRDPGHHLTEMATTAAQLGPDGRALACVARLETGQLGEKPRRHLRAIGPEGQVPQLGEVHAQADNRLFFKDIGPDIDARAGDPHGRVLPRVWSSLMCKKPAQGHSNLTFFAQENASRSARSGQSSL